MSICSQFVNTEMHTVSLTLIRSLGYNRKYKNACIITVPERLSFISPQSLHLVCPLDALNDLQQCKEAPNQDCT